MPHGFVGRAPIRYLGDAQVDHAAAGNAITAAGNLTGRRPNIIPLPHRPEDAMSGGFTTGRNNSSNIVANQEEYARVVNLVRNADNRMADCLQSIATAIDGLCQSAFVLPKTTPLCTDVSGTLRGSLGDFRSLTNEMLSNVNSYASEIVNVR